MANYPIKNIVVGSDTYNIDTNFALVQLSYTLTTSDNLSGKTFAEILSNYNGTWTISSITDAKGSHNPSTEMLINLGRSLNYTANWTITHAGGGGFSGSWGTGCKPVNSSFVVIPLTGNLGSRQTISGFVYLYVNTSTNTVTQYGVFSNSGGGGSMDYDIIASEFGDDAPSHPQVYSQYDIVIDNGTYYRSIINNNTDTLDVPTSWAPTNMQSASYVSDGNFCIADNEYYINMSGGSQSWDPGHWSDMGFVKADYKGNWSAGTSGYAVGDYCIYNDNLYRCTTANAGTTWNASQWTRTQIMPEISNLSIANLDGVSITSPTAGDTLTYDGTNWINTAGSSGSNAIVLESTSIMPITFFNNLTNANNAGNAYNINFTTHKTKSQLITAWSDINTEIYLQIGPNIAKIITRYRDTTTNELTFVAQYGNTMVIGSQPHSYIAYQCSNIFGVLNFSGTSLSSIDFYIDNSYYSTKY